MLKRAISLGVRIALGTDAGVYPHGENAAEFGYMAADGMPADIVAVPGNPLQDIKVTQSVFFVMKDGVLCRNERAEPNQAR